MAWRHLAYKFMRQDLTTQFIHIDSLRKRLIFYWNETLSDHASHYVFEGKLFSIT